MTYGQDTIDGRKAFGANFVNVGYFDIHDGKLNSFQLILIDRSDIRAGDFDIEFNYGRIVWETGDASGGSNGFGGTPASVGWSNGSGLKGTSYELEGSLVSGALLDTGAFSLVKRRMNSDVFGRYVFRARDGQISPGLSITSSADLPPATVGESYSATLTASGATPPYRWSLVEDPGVSLPGVELSQDGTLSGTPTAVGTFEFTLKAESTTPDGVENGTERVRLVVLPKSPSIAASVCPLPAGTLGYSYSYVLQSTPGTSPARWTWATDSGASPVPGLNLTTEGLISGTPTEIGTFPVELVLTSTDRSVAPLSKGCAITVSAQPANITSGACPAQVATAGVPYSDTVHVSGGAAPFRWQVNGMLPAGMALDPSGALSGTPRVPGWYQFELWGTDSQGNTVSQHCSLSVHQQQVHILSSCPLPPASTSSPYLTQLQASGGSGQYAWHVVGSLPAGLTLTPDGVLSGHTYQPGPAQFQLIVEDSAGAAGAQPCSLFVESAGLTVSSCPLPAASVGQYYQRKLEALDGWDPYTWSASSLPAGLQVSSTGTLKGTPTQPGDYNIGLTVKDVSGHSSSISCPFSVLPEVVQITSDCPLPEATLGSTYSTTLEAEGGFGNFTWSTLGKLTPGLTLSPDGVLSGTPQRAGISEFTLLARDDHGNANALECSMRAKMPGQPTLSISGLEDPIHPASGLRPIDVRLAEPYPLDLRGTLVVETVADTGSATAEIDRTDPAVKFLEGSTAVPFVIYAGYQEAEATLATSGTVAGTISVSVKDLTAAGVQVPNTAGTLTAHVERKPAILTGACFQPGNGTIDLNLTGYTTTRNLTTAVVVLGSDASARTINVPVDTYALEYFGSELSIRTGGTFNLTIPVTLPPRSATPTSVHVDLYNEVGAFGGRQASRCQ